MVNLACFKRILVLVFFTFSVTSFAQVQVTSMSTVSGRTKATSHQKKKHLHDSTATSSKGAFIPVPFIITDQNLGYGGFLALAYIHPNKKSTRKETPPNITALAGGGTSTKTWAVGIMHSHSFKNDHIRYFGGFAVTNINLDFYQIGGIDLSKKPISVNMKGWGTIQNATFRLGNSNIFIGPQYGFLAIETSLNKDQEFIVPDSIDVLVQTSSHLSALGLLANYDNRDNTLSPTTGFYAGIELNANNKAIGASQNFYKFEGFFYYYLPITKWLYSIYHFDGQFTGGDVPFYTKPFVQLRGAPAMRYQGNYTMLVETQWRANVYKDIAVLAFAGAGKAFNDFSDFKNDPWVANYGTGLRYTLKKAMETRVGVDFAWANSDFGWYIVVGTSF